MGERLAIHGGDPVRREALGFHRAIIGDEEIAAVSAALRSGWLTTGPRAREFEEKFTARVGARHGIAMNSCTAALHIGLLARDIGAGDEVITTPITFAATANVIAHTGATPVFADVDSATLCLDPAAAIAAITPRTKAIIPVHYLGHAVDLDPLLEVARQRGIMVLIDAAHSIETTYKGRLSGADGDAVAYSFYATKNLTTGEGGMLTTPDTALAERARKLRLHGMSRDAFRRYEPGAFVPYTIEEAGWKYNLTDAAAALGLAQMQRLDSMLARRQVLAARIDAALAGTPGVSTLMTRPWTTKHAQHLKVILLDLDVLAATREEFARALVAEGISVSVHFTALHLEPYYARTYGFAPGLCPIAESAGARVLSLPFFPAMSDADADDVIAAVKKVATALAGVKR